MEKGQKEREIIMKKMEAQPISENDLANILALHQRRLGWSYLLEETISDRALGFPCENEEFAIRRQLRTTVQNVSEWFRMMGRKEKWPSMEGWIWEIDFEAGQAVPKKQGVPKNSTGSGQKESECSLLVEGPIMTLGDMELDIVKRLLEKRNTLADSVRSHLRLFLNGKFPIDKLNTMVQQLAASDKDVRNWSSEMADKYKWSRLPDNSWMYRVDIAESKVYLTRRSNFG